MMNINSLLVIGLFANIYLSEAHVSCYYGSWANYRYDKGHFAVTDIDPFVCDELIYAFAGLNATSNEIMMLDPFLDSYDDYGKGGYDQFTNLKRDNSQLKTTLSVGGWNEGSEKYSIMAADPVKRDSFVASAVKMLVDHQFDGLDMDWEFPGSRGGSPSDKFNYIILLQELKASLNFHGLTLTAAIPASVEALEAGFDIPYFSHVVDYIHVMNYDYHGAWENFTHHHAPLSPHVDDEGLGRTLNAMYTIDYLIQEGADPQKLVLGIPTYGRCFTLASYDYTGIYAPSIGPGRQGPYSRETGYLGYNEICELQQLTGDWMKVRDFDMQVPYAYRYATEIWCGYDDPVSVKNKGLYAAEKELGGVMTWSIETDDFRGVCGRNYDLIRSMREGFEQVIPTSISPTDTTTSEQTTPMETTDTTTTDEPTDPVTTPEPTDPVTTPEPTDPVTTPEPTDPVTTAEPTDPATTAEPTDPATTPEPTDPVTTPKPTDPATTAEPTDPVTTPEPTDPATTAEPTDPATTTTAKTTTSGGSGPPDCDPTEENYFVPHEECDKYWQCSYGQAYMNFCPDGLYWNPAVDVCDFPENVDTSNCIEP